MTPAEAITGLLNRVWNDGHTPWVYVDATHKDVIVPEHVRTKFGDHLPIELNARYPLNIKFDNIGIHADLAFSGGVTRCTFPWVRIYLVVDKTSGRGAFIEAHRPDRFKEANGVVEMDLGAPPTKAEAEAAIPNRAWSPRVIKGGKAN